MTKQKVSTRTLNPPQKYAEIEKEAREEGSPFQWVSLCARLDDSTYLTKMGDLCTVLRVHGIDTECLDEAETKRVCQSFESALKMLGPEYRVYQYAIKRDRPNLPEPNYKDPLSVSRSEWMEERRQKLYDINLYLVVLRMRPAARTTGLLGFLSMFSMEHCLRLSRRETDRESRLLALAVEQLCVSLRETIRPEVLNPTEACRFLMGILNLTPWKAEPRGPLPSANLDQYLCRSSYSCWPGHLTMDDYYIRLLSLIEPPSQSVPHMLRALLNVPANMIVCTEWNRIDNTKMLKRLENARLHYHSFVTSWLPGLFSKGQNPLPHEVLLDETKISMVQVLAAAKKEIENKENTFGDLHYTVALFHEDESELQRALAFAYDVFGTYSATMLVEQTGILKAWASLMPGNYPYSRPPMTILNVAHAELSPGLFAPAQGELINEHLEKPSACVFETNEQTLFYFNPHVQDVGHTLILGKTGSGKSFLCNQIISGLQQYGGYTVIFDLGERYKALTQHYGGGYLHIGKESEDVTINPFCLPQTPENLEFLFSFVRVLIERPGTPTMTPKEKEDLFTAIENLYFLPPSVRTLSSLARMCAPSYTHRLDEWVDRGRLAKYFDHPTDNLTLSRFQTFDFLGMDSAEVLEPMFFYILHRSLASIYDPAQQDVLKVVLMDEAFQFFAHPATHDYIHRGLKTWRARNASMILATQSTDDLQRSGLMPTIRGNCPTKIFLANSDMDNAAYQEAFGLNETEAQWITRLAPKRQFLLQQENRPSKILNLFTDPESYKVFANK